MCKAPASGSSCGWVPATRRPETSGISHVLEHMAFKGTTTRSVQAINLDAERLGADVNAFTSKDTTGYFMTGLGKHVDQFLKMTADIVLNSTFPEAELKRELEVIRQEVIEYLEDPQESSSQLLDRAIWGDHPMGMPVIGTVQNIERFTRDDLIAHVKSHYVANNTIVAAAGNFDVEAFLGLAEPALCRHAPIHRWHVAGAVCAGTLHRERLGTALQPGVAGLREHGLPPCASEARRDPAAALATRRIGGGHPVRRRNVCAADGHHS